MLRLALALILVAAAFAAAAAEAMPEALGWLRKMSTASRELNYSGTFIYQLGPEVRSSRITHVVDRGVEQERLETLDGLPREIVRNNDSVMAYIPEARLVIVERRNKGRLAVLLPELSAALGEFYALKKGELDRVAGYECQWIVLEPRDDRRYGHRFCAEVGTGLLLRARMTRDGGDGVESFAFTELKIGAGVGRDLVKSHYAAKSGDWKIDRSALDVGEGAGDTGWEVRSHPPGFRKVTEMKRSIAGLSGPVSQIVYSDGLAAVSIFVEPGAGPARATLWKQGATNFYTRAVANHVVRVLGEVPEATIRQIGDSVAPRPR
jgi:sigma-E factor negative regulatory protein RseB